MVVGDRDHDHLLRAVLGRPPPRCPARTCPACRRSCAGARASPSPSRGEEALGGLRRRDRDQPAAAQHRERHPAAGGEPVRLLVAVRARAPTRPRRCAGRQPHARRRTRAGRARRSPRRCGLMKSANAYGSPSSAAHTALCGEEPSSHGLRRLRPARAGPWPAARAGSTTGMRALVVGEQLGQLLPGSRPASPCGGRAAARAWSSGRCRRRGRARGRSARGRGRRAR